MAVTPPKTESCVTLEGYGLGRTTWPEAIWSRLSDNHFPLAAGINKYSNGKTCRDSAAHSCRTAGRRSSW